MMRRIALLGLLAALVACHGRSKQGSADDKTLAVASWGGDADKTYRKVAEAFEKKYGVTIRWVPGTATENAAKVIATQGHPEFDVVFLENLGHAQISPRGVLATLDPKIITHFDDLYEEAKLPSMDALPIGFLFSGFFYNPKEFEKRGWAPPQSWNDMFRPEFCHNIGFPHPNVSYGMNMLIMLAGGKLDNVPDAITRFAKLKGCYPTLELSSAKLEEKIQLGEYLVGVSGDVRMLPLAKRGYPVKFVVPIEGTPLSYTVIAPVTGAAHGELAQRLCDWFIGPEAQKILLDDMFYLPANAKVEVPPEIIALGKPGPEILSRAVKINGAAVAAKRHGWIRRIEHEAAP